MNAKALGDYFHAVCVYISTFRTIFVFPFLLKLQAEIPAQMISSESCKIFKNIFLTEDLWMAASISNTSATLGADLRSLET